MKTLYTLYNPIRLLAAVFFAAAASWASAATINVPADYPDIIDAVYAANPGDEVVIQTGVYNEAGQVFVWAPMTLTGTNGPVTIHCTSDQEAVAEVASAVTGVVFNGLTFERPSADDDWMRTFQVNNSAEATFNNCDFSGPANGVGVIQFFGGSATYNNCTFSNFAATASWAAAIFCEGSGGAGYGDVIVSNCTFDIGCNAWIRMSPFQSPPFRLNQMIVKKSIFKTPYYSQALAFWDGGQYAIDYNPTNQVLFQDCTFQGATTNTFGFANYGETAGFLNEVEFDNTTNGLPQSVTFSRCVFNAYDSGSMMVWLDLPAPFTFENCVFAGGQHETVMTISTNGPPSANFYYCTMINDGVSAAIAVSGTPQSSFINGWDYGRTFNIVDCLFRCPTNYSAGFVCDPASTGTRNYAVSHSVIDHRTPTGAFAEITLGAGGYTNISLGSAFVNPANRDYHLKDGLPWVNGGIDLGYTLDVADNARIQAGVPDMGAYESSFTTPLPTVGIANSVGSVNISFIGVLQSATQVNGPYKDVPLVASPLTVSPTGSSFWRARSP